MQSGIQYEEVEWFAMRVTYHRELEAKRLLDERGVENFIPMKYEKSARTGRTGRSNGTGRSTRLIWNGRVF